MLVLEKLKEFGQTGRIALINREERLSYGELDARSDAFAAYLLAQLGDDRTPIVLYGQKETDYLPCILGVLKSGRAYVPVDRTLPENRVASILEDIGPRLIVDFGGFPSPTKAQVLEGEKLDEILSTPAQSSPAHWVSGDDLAYILFTSGSTGRPKGVSITADNLDAFCGGLLPFYPEEDEGGVILNQAAYSFDVSGCAVYAGLARGMALFTVHPQMTENMGELFAGLEQSGLTLWVSTPSFAELCILSRSFTQERLPNLKQFLFCGEVLTHTLCDALAERFPRARILNTYGPTEATVLVTAAEITSEIRRDNRSIPIGAPIAGTTLRLVDQSGREVLREGEVGELLILGESVGPGYWGRPDLTGRAFFTNQQTGLRGYRTGDLCYRENGLYYYCGRVDNQLKLGGFRIELEDVERNLERLENVARAAVVPVYQGEKAAYLAAFLLLKGPDGLPPLKRTIQLKKQAAAFLPAYMIPRRITVVDAFPLNLNGKIDRQALAKGLEGAP